MLFLWGFLSTSNWYNSGHFTVEPENPNRRAEKLNLNPLVHQCFPYDFLGFINQLINGGAHPGIPPMKTLQRTISICESQT